MPQCRRIYDSATLELEREMNILWLFLPNKAGLKVLAGFEHAMMKRYARTRAQMFTQREQTSELSGVDGFIRSGAWLFQKRTRLESQNYLARLVSHSNSLCKKFWGFSDLMDDSAMEEEQDNQCLESILFVFPLQESELNCTPVM